MKKILGTGRREWIGKLLLDKLLETRRYWKFREEVILGNDQLDALFLNVFILCLYMFRAASAHDQEDQIVLVDHLV
jgi:hypothetical protein